MNEAIKFRKSPREQVSLGMIVATFLTALYGPIRIKATHRARWGRALKSERAAGPRPPPLFTTNQYSLENILQRNLQLAHVGARAADDAKVAAAVGEFPAVFRWIWPALVSGLPQLG